MKKGTRKMKDKKLLETVAKMQGQKTFTIIEIREISRKYIVKAMDERKAYQKLRDGKIGYTHGVEYTGSLRDYTRYELVDKGEEFLEEE